MCRFLPCLALALAAAPVGMAVEGPVTYSRDAAPIFFEHCAMCHRPGAVAPMSLLTYEEARPWAKSIAKAVREKNMPPWSGESEHHQWQNDISLSDNEMATILAWVEKGAPQGDPKDLPPTPMFPEGWTLGEPDYVITLKKIDVPAAGEDLFTKETINIDLGARKWVKAIEFMPGDRRATHHFQTTYSGASSSDAAGTTNGPIGGILAVWTAGMPPFVFPEGVGRPIGPKARILIDAHYHPFGEAVSDESKIGLYFGEGELKKEVATLAIANTGIRIPPGAPNHSEECFNLLDRDMEILAFSPHMHFRGKSMRYDLVRPDGSRETLLDVPRYHYAWQWQYYPTKPIPAPAGSRIEVTAAWDNSAGNAANPDPTQEIIYRGDTLHEMFVGFVEVIPSEGVYHQPAPATEKIKTLLAKHPAGDSYMVNGFLPFGMYVPKTGEGWMYAVQGLNMFAITLDDIQWDGDHLKVVTQLPTPEASATTSIFEGVRGADGKLTGTFQYGVDAARPMKINAIAIPMAAPTGD